MVDSQRDLTLIADGEQIAQGLRLHFKGRQNMSMSPDFFEVDVYNFSDDEYSDLLNAKSIDVCGNGGKSLCHCKLEEVYHHRDSDGKDITTLILSDGSEFWRSIVSFSIGKGNMIESTIRKILNMCSYPISITSYLAPDIQLLRGCVFHGRTADYVSTLAKSVNARAFVIRNTLNIVQRGRFAVSTILDDEDLLEDLHEVNGAYIAVLRDMISISVGQMVKMQGSGKLLRVVSQCFEADSYRGAWSNNLILVDETQMTEKDGNEWGGG